MNTMFQQSVDMLPLDPGVEFGDEEWLDSEILQAMVVSGNWNSASLAEHQSAYLTHWEEAYGSPEFVVGGFDYPSIGQSVVEGIVAPEGNSGVSVIESTSLNWAAQRSDVQSRLDEINRHFRRKAAAVLNDDVALRLLALLSSQIAIETADFDFCRYGRALAKLSAAHFCEVGANSVYITERGQRLISSFDPI